MEDQLQPEQKKIKLIFVILGVLVVVLLIIVFIIPRLKTSQTAESLAVLSEFPAGVPFTDSGELLNTKKFEREKGTSYLYSYFVEEGFSEVVGSFRKYFYDNGYVITEDGGVSFAKLDASNGPNDISVVVEIQGDQIYVQLVILK